jgi:hypothetical protein
MIETLPLFLRKSQVLQEVFKAEEKKIQLSASDLEDMRKQMDVSTATWGLAIYEKEFQIKTDLSKPLSERRSVIKSKWRGAGKIDAALIKMVADAYTNGDVDISFDGRINIKFNSIIGIPPNLQDLQNALEDIKPVHLRIIYEFAYLLIKEIHNVVTLSEIEQIQLNKFAGGV